MGLLGVSRTPCDAELTDKIETCGFNVALNTDSRVYIPFVPAFCIYLSSTYCLKEEGNEHHQPKNLRNLSEMLLKDHLSLPSVLPSLFCWCCVSDWLFSVPKWVSVAPLIFAMHWLVAQILHWETGSLRDRGSEKGNQLVFQQERRSICSEQNSDTDTVWTAAGWAETQKRQAIQSFFYWICYN